MTKHISPLMFAFLAFSLNGACSSGASSSSIIIPKKKQKDLEFFCDTKTAKESDLDNFLRTAPYVPGVTRSISITLSDNVRAVTPDFLDSLKKRVPDAVFKQLDTSHAHAITTVDPQVIRGLQRLVVVLNEKQKESSAHQLEQTLKPTLLQKIRDNKSNFLGALYYAGMGACFSMCIPINYISSRIAPCGDWDLRHYYKEDCIDKSSTVHELALPDGHITSIRTTDVDAAASCFSERCEQYKENQIIDRANAAYMAVCWFSLAAGLALWTALINKPFYPSVVTELPTESCDSSSSDSGYSSDETASW